MAGQKTGKDPMQVVVRILAVAAVLLALLVGCMGYILWRDHQAVFRNVTAELGTQSLGIRDFLTDKAVLSRAGFVTDPGTIDLSRIGTHKLRLRHGTRVSDVYLTVVDTQAPVGEVTRELTLQVGQPLPEAQELVQSLEDESQVRIYYAREPSVPEDYSDLTVEVVLEDAVGNQTRHSCLLRFAGWMKESLTLELGQSLTAELLLADPQRDAERIEKPDLGYVNTVGEHTVTLQLGSARQSCRVTVVDTTAPTLTVRNVRRFPGESVVLEDFVAAASDLSGQPVLRAVRPLPDCSVEGTHTVTIEAVDASGNVTTREATLWVSKNQSPPVIQGAAEALSVEKHSQPDLMQGVWAKDDLDGRIEAAVDASALDLTQAGTYYITYSATDSSGNVGTLKRRVVVEPDGEDTAALVRQIADTLPDDPAAIRDYVHDSIAYGSSWGGDDPVWHGFTVHSGNCNVHAHCLKALLECKGYETQLIWVTNKSHYWLIVKLEEGWRHIDSTPSAQHEKIGIATDQVRYANLNGRNWDRSQWPACE